MLMGSASFDDILSFRSYNSISSSVELLSRGETLTVTAEFFGSAPHIYVFLLGSYLAMRRLFFFFLALLLDC